MIAQDKPSGTNFTVLLESERLCRARILRKYDTEGSRWLIYQGAFFSQQSRKSLTQRWFSQRSVPKHAAICMLDYVDYFDEMIIAGEQAIEFLERKSAVLAGTVTGQFLECQLSSPKVFYALKKQLAKAVRDRIFFFRLARLLSRGSKNFIAVRDGGDLLGLDADHENEFGMINVGRFSWQQLSVSLLMILGHFSVFVLRRGVSIHKQVARQVDFATPVVRGFKPQMEHVKLWQPDDYLWDDRDFAPHRFLYVQSLWLREKSRRDTRVHAVEQIRMNGASYTDVRKLPLSPDMFFRCMRDTIELIRATLRDVKAGCSNPMLIDAARRTLFAIFEEKVFLEHWAPKVYLCRAEYNPGHIIRTVLFNQRGLKTIGIPHSTYLPQGLVPEMACVYYNTFCVYGLGYVSKHWSPTWMASNRVVEIGFDQNDETFRVEEKGRPLEILRERYPYPVILSWFPPATARHAGMREHRILDIVQAINKIVESHPEVGVIVKPRNADFPFYERLMKQGILGQRIHLLDRDFTTPELIAASDVIVTSTISSVFVQAACVNKERIVTVDYFDWEGHPFRAYSQTFVVSDASKLIERVGELLAGVGVDRVGLAALRRDFDPFSDGRAVERYKAEVLRLLEEAPGRRPQSVNAFPTFSSSSAEDRHRRNSGQAVR